MTNRLEHVRKLVGSCLKRADWPLISIMTAALGGLLLYVTIATPYRPPSEPSAFYTEASQTAASPYQRARVTSGAEDGALQGVLLDGHDKDLSVKIRVGSQSESNQPKVGDVIIVTEVAHDEQKTAFAYVDTLRLPILGALLVLFIVLVALVGGRRGAMSVVGLLLSVLVVGWFIIPLISQGYNALLVALAGSYMIAIVAVLVSHGWRKRTFISVGCILAVVTFVAGLAWLMTWLAGLTGVADETAFWVSHSNEQLDMRGIVAGGIIIASLGVLDDIVTTQVATVEELYKANRTQTRKSLFRAASSVGSEHIASLVNTLVLAYVGASLPFVLAVSQHTGSSFMILNGEYIATEIVRTLVASIGLVLAVPLSTLVAVMAYRRSLTQKRV